MPANISGDRRAKASQVVVVTGASAGVGRATALRFARTGASLALIARDETSLEQVRTEIERLGGRAIALPLDVADPEAVFAAAEEAERQLGPIDIWVNDAMLTVFSPVSEISPEEFRRVTEVTYLGYVHGTMAALRHMRPRNRGVIVQVGSALAYRGIPLQAAYCGAKHAIRGFTDSLRTELLHERSPIKLVMVQLPAVNTPQFDWARAHTHGLPRPVPPVVQPEVAARTIFHAARHPTREVWLGTATIKAILANFLAPGLLDRILARTAFDAQQEHEPVSPGRRDNLDQPLTELHRTRGSFAGEASRSSLALSGATARGLALGAGLGLAAVSAVILSRLADIPARSGRRRLSRRW